MRNRTLGKLTLILTLIASAACMQSNKQGTEADTAALAPSHTASTAANIVGDKTVSEASPDDYAETRKYHVLCTSRQHVGGWCKQYDTLSEADAALAKHRKDTGHTDNGRSAGKCPIAPEP